MKITKKQLLEILELNTEINNSYDTGAEAEFDIENIYSEINKIENE